MYVVVVAFALGMTMGYGVASCRFRRERHALRLVLKKIVAPT